VAAVGQAASAEQLVTHVVKAYRKPEWENASRSASGCAREPRPFCAAFEAGVYKGEPGEDGGILIHAN